MSTRLRDDELATGLRMLATLCAAGLPVGRVVGAFPQLATRGWTRPAADLRQRVVQGSSLSQALSASVPTMPPHLIAILQVGEAAGDLSGSLDRVAREAERAEAQRRELMQALAYPSVLAVSGLVCIATIVLVVLPQFEQLLRDLGQELPASARALLMARDAVPSVLLVVSIAVVGLAARLRTSGMQQAEVEQLHRWYMEAPMIGRAVHARYIALLCAALSALTATRVALPTALAHLQSITPNRFLARGLATARAEVIRGQRLSAALEEAEVVPRRFGQLIRVGEESGTLSAALQQVAELAHRENADALRRLIRWIEPIVVLTVAGLTGGIAAVLMQAMYSIRPV